MVKLKKKPYIIASISFFLLASLSFFLYYHNKENVFPWKEFLITTGTVLVVVTLIAITIYNILSFKERKKEELESDAPREFVDYEDVKKIMISRIAEETGIITEPKSEDMPVKGMTIPKNKDAVQIVNSHIGHDKSKETDNKFVYMHIIIQEGNMKGHHVFVVRQDLGKKHIYKNWDSIHERYTNFDKSEYKPRETPTSSSKNEITRLLGKRYDNNSGDEEDLHEVTMAMVKQLQQPNGENKSEKKKEETPKVELNENIDDIDKYK